MKYLFKIFIFSSLCLGATQQYAHGTGIQSALLLNTGTNIFDCFFNSHISVLGPTDKSVDIEINSIPLMRNQSLNSHALLQRFITNTLLSSKINSKFNFCGITSSLTPAGFYYKTQKVNFTKLLNLSVKRSNIDLNKNRMLDKNMDSSNSGFELKIVGFFYGFTFRGYHQLRNGNEKFNQAEKRYTLLGYQKTY